MTSLSCSPSIIRSLHFLPYSLNTPSSPDMNQSRGQQLVQRRPGHFSVAGRPAEVSSVIFVYFKGLENEWTRPLDFHPPSEAPHVGPGYSNAKGL